MKQGEVLLYDNGTDKQFVSVVFKDETFWLTQSGMAELYLLRLDIPFTERGCVYVTGNCESPYSDSQGRGAV